MRYVLFIASLALISSYALAAPIPSGKDHCLFVRANCAAGGPQSCQQKDITIDNLAPDPSGFVTVIITATGDFADTGNYLTGYLTGDGGSLTVNASNMTGAPANGKIFEIGGSSDQSCNGLIPNSLTVTMTNVQYNNILGTGDSLTLHLEFGALSNSLKICDYHLGGPLGACGDGGGCCNDNTDAFIEEGSCEELNGCSNGSVASWAEWYIGFGGGGATCTDDQDCDDNNACNGNETCDLPTGTCQAGPPPVCNDNLLCTTDVCHFSSGCMYFPMSQTCCLDDPESCDDGIYCNGEEGCSGNGECSLAKTVSCDPGWICVEDTGNGEPGCICDDNGDCDDGQFCNGPEVCSNGSCSQGSPPDCLDAHACTINACDELTDSCLTIPDNSVCDDSLWCNGSETCDINLGCISGTSPCDDSIACTDDTCNESKRSCSSAPNDSLCDDGLYCNGSETCDVVLGCQDNADPDCNDGVGCTDDSCNETTDTCDNVVNDFNCPDDGLYCNGTEFCDGTLDCQSTGNPCSGNCNEENDNCLACVDDNDCNSSCGESCLCPIDETCPVSCAAEDQRCVYFDETVCRDTGSNTEFGDICLGGGSSENVLRGLGQGCNKTYVFEDAPESLTDVDLKTYAYGHYQQTSDRYTVTLNSSSPITWTFYDGEIFNCTAGPPACKYFTVTQADWESARSYVDAALQTGDGDVSFTFQAIGVGCSDCNAGGVNAGVHLSYELTDYICE